MLVSSHSLLTASSSVTCEGNEMLVLPSIWEDGWPASEVMRLVGLGVLLFLMSQEVTVALANIMSRAGDDGGSVGICPMGIRLQIVLCLALRHLEMPPFFWRTFREVNQATWIWNRKNLVLITVIGLQFYIYWRVACLLNSTQLLDSC